MTCSDTSLAPPSTITMASREAAMMTSRSHSARCARVGLATNWPFSRPTRTPAMGPSKGMSETWSAAEAPVSASTSVSFSWSNGDHRRDDLRLVGVALGEERPAGAVDDPGGERLLLGEASLAPEEAARDAAGGVELLLVVDREREEVDALLPLRVGHRRDEHDRVAQADPDRAVRLLRDLAGLEEDFLAADLRGLLDGGHVHLPSGRRRQWRPRPSWSRGVELASGSRRCLSSSLGGSSTRSGPVGNGSALALRRGPAQRARFTAMLRAPAVHGKRERPGRSTGAPDPARPTCGCRAGR